MSKELTKRNLELFIIGSYPFETHPGLVAILCKEFGLDWDKIQEMWLYKRNPELFKEKLKEYY